MLRRSAPPSSRCVAKLWRSACGEAPSPTPTRDVHVRSRRRTSLVPSGRPVLLRNSASSSPSSAFRADRRRGARERRPRPFCKSVRPARRRPDRGQRRLADGHEARLAPLALHPQLLAVVVDVGAAQRDELLGAQPARVGELEHRAVAQLQRPRRRSQGSPSSSARRPRARSARAADAQPRRGVETRSAGFWAIRPCSRWLANSARSAASLRAEVLGAARSRLVSARRGARRSGARPSARPRCGASPRTIAQRANWPHIDRVRAARARGRVAAAQILVQQRGRRSPHAGAAGSCSAIERPPLAL